MAVAAHVKALVRESGVSVITVRDDANSAAQPTATATARRGRFGGSPAS